VSHKELSPEPPSPAQASAKRIAAIVEAAEEAAAKVIDDAEEEARKYLEDARSRADRIVAEHLRSLADRLDPPASGERRTTHLRPVEPLAPEESIEPEPDTAPNAQDGPAGARLLATQMAVSGSSREEISARLRSSFEIEETAGILDAILGPED
jgi:cell division septum initiation protein DivIVA